MKKEIQNHTYKKKSDSYPFDELNQKIRALAEEGGSVFTFTRQTVSQTFSRPFEWNEFLRQCYLIGNLSFFPVICAGLLCGLIFSMHSSSNGNWAVFEQSNAFLLSEFCPLVVAMICAGKTANSLEAELAEMRQGQQIEAMEISCSSSLKFLVVTRVLASMLMVPALVIFADATAACGVCLANLNSPDSSFSALYYQTVSSAIFICLPVFIWKIIFFGAIIGMTGCYKGFYFRNEKKIGDRSSHSSFVISALLIIVSDLLSILVSDFFR